MPVSSDTIASTFLDAADASTRNETPYPHWFVHGCLPEPAVDAVLGLPFHAPDLEGVSGKRELHNNARTYCDAANQAEHTVCKSLADAFQSEQVTDAIAQTFGARLGGTYLRIEFANDVDGFWLEPHSDLGVKAFTMLLYTSKEPAHSGLGTDIYDAGKSHAGRSPFAPGTAMIFVPSPVTFHGFEKRPIEGVRKSVIINYVTDAWRAREQLAFPENPIR